MQKKFNSILCLNGRLGPAELFTKFQLPIVAADGAFNKLQSLGIVPQLVVGDCDSIENQHIAIEIIKIPDQNTTDFEKCLQVMYQRNLLPTIVFGVSGGESDHIMYNLYCFAKHQILQDSIFIDVNEQQKIKCGFIAKTTNSLVVKKNSMISIIPVPNAVITSKGLNWELEQESLSIFGLTSIRNRAISNDITLDLHSGTALIMLDDYEI